MAISYGNSIIHHNSWNTNMPILIWLSTTIWGGITIGSTTILPFMMISHTNYILNTMWVSFIVLIDVVIMVWFYNKHLDKNKEDACHQ